MTSLIYPITFTSVRPTNTDGVALDNWNPQNTLIWIFLFQFQSGGLGTAVRAQILSWNVNWALWSTLCGLIMEDSQYQSVTGRETLPGQSTAWSRGPSGWSTPGNGRAPHLVVVASPQHSNTRISVHVLTSYFVFHWRRLTCWWRWRRRIGRRFCKGQRSQSWRG